MFLVFKKLRFANRALFRFAVFFRFFLERKHMFHAEMGSDESEATKKKTEMLMRGGRYLIHIQRPPLKEEIPYVCPKSLGKILKRLEEAESEPNPGESAEEPRNAHE